MKSICRTALAALMVLSFAVLARAETAQSYLAKRMSAGLYGKTRHANNGTARSGSANVNQTSGGLTKSGSGTLTLSGSNTYTGTTTVNSGTLRLSDSGSHTSDSTLGSSTFDTIGGAIFWEFNLNNIVTFEKTPSSSGILTTDTSPSDLLGSSAVVNGTLITSGALNLADTSVVQVNAGFGTLALSGTNWYSGATQVTSGTLDLNGSSAISLSATMALSRLTLLPSLLLK